jgi:murein DD-endopeptidase MepM/ murein hydrolase activator NlpD
MNDARLAGSIQILLKQLGFPFRQCLPGDSLKIREKDGKFEKFTYRQSLTIIYYVFYNDRRIVLAMKQPIIETVNRIIRGRINSTLYEALLDLDETPELVYRFADIFGWEIDFTTETQKGDSFYIIMNKRYCDSTFIGYSDIPIARYRGEIGDFYGVFYCDPGDYFDYYSLKGESLRKALLKSPLKYSYISSYFTKNRYHPILKIWRPHHGLDYSAPTGTPVSSIGDGVVTFRGWRGGYGNLVEIRHKNNFRTRYGHLSSFAKGLTGSKHVKMGEIIGYVGSTGLSTGPHLHFELYKDGAPINPTTVKLPRAPSVKKDHLPAFARERDSLLKVIVDEFAAPVVTEKGKGK